MKRRIFSSVLAVIMIFSVTVFAASADSAVDLTGLTASDSTVNFHINEIYSKIDVLEYRSLSEVVAYANALRSAAENDTAASDIAIEWNGTVYGLEEFCDEIVFPVIPMGSGARSMADAVMDDDTLWPFGTSVKDPSQTVYDSAAYAEVYDLWKHLRDDHKDGFLPVSEFVTEKAQLEAKIRALTAPGEVPTTALTIRGANVTLQESISLFFAIGDVSEYTDVYMEFSVNGVVTKVTESLVKGGMTCYMYPGISAKQGGDIVTATLCGTYEGVEYRSSAFVYSVADYCYSRLAKSTDNNFKKVCVDLLNYCSAAQVYFNYNTDNLANARLTEEQKALGSSSYQTLTDNSFKSEYTDYGIKAFNLLYEDVIKVMVAVDAPTTEGLVAKVSFDGMTYTFNEYYEQVIAGQVYYIFDFTKIAPTQFRNTFAVTFEVNGVVVGGTGTYSVESYLSRMIPKTTNEAYKALLEATAMYGDSCAAYFG